MFVSTCVRVARRRSSRVGWCHVFPRVCIYILTDEQDRGGGAMAGRSAMYSRISGLRGSRSRCSLKDTRDGKKVEEVVEEKEVPLGVQFQVPMHNLLGVFVVGDVSGEGTSKGGIEEGGKDQCDSDGGVRKVWSSGSIHKSYDEKEDKVEVSSQYRYA